MKGGKKKNSGIPAATDSLKPPSEPSNGNRELPSDGMSEPQGEEAQQHQQERDEVPEDAAGDGEEELVASPETGEEEEENEEKTYEEEFEMEGDGYDGEADNEKPKLAEGFYEIEAVRRKRIRKGQVQYLIKWRGWPETANTWEPVKNLMSCSDVIESFEESLQSGKQRSTRKRKRKSGVMHTQPKKKQQQQQQQRSPADATYNVPAVKVRIIENPTPSPPLNGLKATSHMDSNGSELNSKEDKVMNDNGLELGFSLEETREQNELNLKLSELKGAMSTNENSVDRSANGLSNGFAKVNGAESLQSDRCTGAKKRKSGSVRRFKQSTAVVMDSIQDAAVGGPLATSVQEGSHNLEVVGSGFVLKNKSDDSKDAYTITHIVKPMSYSTSLSNDMQDVSITFLAKRSDGKEVMVDNKFLKMNNPLLLINYYEQHLRYHPPQ
ncbi:PREDICTED: chromo domain protein LHP1-like [Nicotiana attenuata]|uniref:Chromo domain protein lhp1 n=1 Tax=Nicotiana attenuata TaxID=49451 RepID=A0A1J6J0M6_NICAT|nr:PREDICTED: chromo domain protein LHP1-like [Nicotiana attenuata]OIT03455.1 chromo domain protein lhp1 [Nicotiana attenuata]